jgi:hypothetical protein
VLYTLTESEVDRTHPVHTKFKYKPKWKHKICTLGHKTLQFQQNLDFIDLFIVNYVVYNIFFKKVKLFL